MACLQARQNRCCIVHTCQLKHIKGHLRQADVYALQYQRVRGHFLLPSRRCRPHGTSADPNSCAAERAMRGT